MAYRFYTLTGTEGNDSKTIYQPDSSNQWVYTWDGLGGSDTLSFERLSKSEFKIYEDASGIHVDSISSASHMIYATLKNVESLKFAGSTVSLSTAADTTAPTVSTFSPVDAAISVAVDSSIVISFNESVVKGAGSIQIRTGSATGTVVETFDAATSTRLTFSDRTLTIDPTNSFSGGTHYFVTLAAGTVKDASGNLYAGTTAYDFNTIDVKTPSSGMISSAADETFSGDSGINTVVFSSARSNYSLTQTTNGWLVSSTVNGKDTISNIERLQFSDKNLALDLDAANSAGGIYRLYKAALDRTPDLGGLGYWIAQADVGTKDAVRMATDFTYAAEFKTLYGVHSADNYMTGDDITSLVTKIYENVLNRAPDTGGRDYYAGQITTKSKTVGQVLAEISDSAENKLAVIDLIGTGIEYLPWVV